MHCFFNSILSKRGRLITKDFDESYHVQTKQMEMKYEVLHIRVQLMWTN